MSNTTRALLAVLGTQILARRSADRPGWTWFLPAAAAWYPLTAVIAVGAGWGARRVGLHRGRRAARAAARREVVDLAELTALGLAAGLTFPAALERAARPLSGEIRSEVDGVLRSSRGVGLVAALGAHAGHCRDLFRIAARAVDSGAPVRAAVESFVDDRLAEQRSLDLAAVRRLPVKLLFPLALLILPGFMVLTVGPALLGSAERIAL